MKRYVEVNSDGRIVQETDPLTMFVNAPPPKEVIFCDCMGVGRVCHHVYAGDPSHADAEQREDRHYDITGPHVTEKHQDDWKKHHAGPRCAHRRQFFVDVTHRPEAKLGMLYDEATDTFTDRKKDAAPSAPDRG